MNLSKDVRQFQQYEHNKQLPLTSNNNIKKTTTYGVRNKILAQDTNIFILILMSSFVTDIYCI